MATKKKTRKTKKTTRKTNKKTNKDLEAKITELEGKLSKLSAQQGQKPAEQAKAPPPPPPKASPPPPPPKASPPPTPKPAEAPKPAPKAEAAPPATLESLYESVPVGNWNERKAKTPAFVSDNSRAWARRHATGADAPTQSWILQKAKITGYTAPSNKYFATRQRLAHHPFHPENKNRWKIQTSVARSHEGINKFSGCPIISKHLVSTKACYIEIAIRTENKVKRG